MQREALAFWLREPGAGEIRPVALARPGPRRGGGPDPAVGGQQGHRGPGLRRARPGQPVRRAARALPGRRLPGAGEVRLPQRGRGGGRPARAARAHRVLPASPPDGVRRARLRGDRRTRGRAGGAGRARRHRRDGRERAVGRRAADRGPGGGRRGGNGRLLRRPVAGPLSRRLRHAGRHRPAACRGGVVTGRGLLLVRAGARWAATWSSTRAPPRQASSCRSSCSRRRARSSS